MAGLLSLAGLMLFCAGFAGIFLLPYLPNAASVRRSGSSDQ